MGPSTASVETGPGEFVTTFTRGSWPRRRCATSRASCALLAALLATGPLRGAAEPVIACRSCRERAFDAARPAGARTPACAPRPAALCSRPRWASRSARSSRRSRRPLHRPLVGRAHRPETEPSATRTREGARHGVRGGASRRSRSPRIRCAGRRPRPGASAPPRPPWRRCTRPGPRARNASSPWPVRVGAAPERLVARVREGEASWGEEMRAAGPAPKDVDGLVRSLVRRRRATGFPRTAPGRLHPQDPSG